MIENGGGGRATNPPLYLIDSIDVSSLIKSAIFEKAAHLYAEGHTLREVSQTLDVPHSTIRDALAGGGVVLRPKGIGAGGHPRGTPPYGYVVVAGKLIADPREQKVLGRILSMWRSGKTFHAIAETLNRQGVRPRLARRWMYASIQKIIRRHQQT